MASIEYNGPTIYRYADNILDKNNKITPRVLTGLENVLDAYITFVPKYAKVHDNNPRNFMIEKVYVAGSGARERRYDSDLDLLLIAPHIDETTEKDIKIWMSLLFFNDRPKQQAIDVFVRPYDRFPDRPSVDISKQVKKLLRRYNTLLSQSK